MINAVDQCYANEIAFRNAEAAKINCCLANQSRERGGIDLVVPIDNRRAVGIAGAMKHNGVRDVIPA